MRIKNLILLFFLVISVSPLTDVSAQKRDDPAKDTVVVSRETLNECGKALDELEAQDKLIASMDAEIKLLKERIELEKERMELHRQIAESRTKQAESLTEANNALKEALSAKDKVIENKDKEIEVLKKKKPSLLKTIQTIAVGVGIGLILK